MIDARDRLVFALDSPTAAEALPLAEQLVGEVGWLKIATTLHTRAGADFATRLRELGFRLFFDLKFHDIPAQVEGACRAAVQAGASMLTVHASGGPAMLEAAVRGADGRATVLAVTVLTSLDESDLAAVGVLPPLPEQVARLARLAADCGCDGVVASAQELPVLRAAAPSLRYLTPGIRTAGGDAGDQKRVVTPGDAITAGATWLVVGRPIRLAPDPRAAARSFVAAIAEAAG